MVAAGSIVPCLYQAPIVLPCCWAAKALTHLAKQEIVNEAAANVYPIAVGDYPNDVATVGTT